MGARRKSKYTRGRWMIERERCQIPFGTPPPLVETGYVDMAEGVRAILGNLGLTELQWTSSLVESWLDIVGPQLARHTRPGRMYGDELVVYVDSPVWLHELSRYGLKAMTAKVQAHTGKNKLKAIRLQLDPDG